MFGAGWVVVRVTRDSGEMVRTELRLQQLSGRILQLDEVLTMSARMAAATGDPSWEARYRANEQSLRSSRRRKSDAVRVMLSGAADGFDAAVAHHLLSTPCDNAVLTATVERAGPLVVGPTGPRS